MFSRAPTIRLRFVPGHGLVFADQGGYSFSRAPPEMNSFKGKNQAASKIRFIPVRTKDAQ